MKACGGGGGQGTGGAVRRVLRRTANPRPIEIFEPEQGFVGLTVRLGEVLARVGDSPGGLKIDDERLLERGEPLHHVSVAGRQFAESLQVVVGARRGELVVECVDPIGPHCARMHLVQPYVQVA